MNVQTHGELASLIWRICNLLRGPYKRNEYRKVILPLTVLRRFDCVLADANGNAPGAGDPQFFNESRLNFPRLLDDPNSIAPNLTAYIEAFSPNVRQIMERFGFGDHIERMDEKNLLFQVVQEFSKVDLSPSRVDNTQMGYVFEELIRIGAEQSNEEAGEHFTPREVIRLMVSLLLSPETDLTTSYVIKTIYDPACGTGGMLSAASEFLREHNSDARPIVFGQDLNDESWAVCKSDMLIKGEDADNIVLGDVFTDDGHVTGPLGTPLRFDYMLANPPFGVEWKQQASVIRSERSTRGDTGRFGAGLPRISDGSLLFLQHMISKMRPVDDGGSRIAIVFNGSPLFTGDAGSGESDIRKWIIENDWLETIVALPDQLFYNTGISTYVWVLTNRKQQRRRDKIQLIDGRQFFVKMRKSLGNKRNELSREQIDDLTRVHGSFTDGETRDLTDEDPVTHLERTRPRIVNKVFDNDDFGYRKITVERPLRLNFAATPERIARLEEDEKFGKLTQDRKRPGRQPQEVIRSVLCSVAQVTGGELYKNRESFSEMLKETAKCTGARIYAEELKVVLTALGERDPDAEICRDNKGNPEPDSLLRDTENVPLKENVGEYMEREVLPYAPDAWVDYKKTKIGYEIPLKRHFYLYEPPRPLEEIESDLRSLEREIAHLFAEVKT